MGSREGLVAVLAPMPRELRPVVAGLGLRRSGTLGRAPLHTGQVGSVEVLASGTGIGPERALAATIELLTSHPVGWVVVAGIAGGIAGATVVGELVVPAEVVDAVTGERFRASPLADVVPSGVLRTGDGSDYELDDADVAVLRGQGVDALDMETAAVARACDDHDVPWTAFRAISDMAGDVSLGPETMTLVDGDGRPRVGAALRFVATHPTRLPRLIRLGRDAERAASLAAEAATAAIRRAAGTGSSGRPGQPI